MVYTELLPATDSVMHLAEIADFPASRNQLSRKAWNYGFGTDTQHFLELFPADEIFKSREDFSVRSQELMFLIREEQNMDNEGSLSQQD
jgi:hypothetical protein